MIIKNEKLTYKFKALSFNGIGQLTDEDGNVVDLINELEDTFKDKVFSLTCSTKDTTKIKD